MAAALLGAQLADGTGMHECWAGASMDTAGAAMHHAHHPAEHSGHGPAQHHESNRTCPCALTGHTATLAWSPAVPVLVAAHAIARDTEHRATPGMVSLPAAHRLPFAIGPPRLA